MASTRLDRTISSTGNRKILTFSAWIKRSKLGVWQNVASFGQGGNRDYIAFDSSDRFEVAQYAGGQTYQIKTTRVFRDTSAFYHIQYAIDTNQATASNRLKIYVNGVQETVFTNSSYPAEDLQMYYNLSGENQKIGSDTDNSNYFDGSMSHINYIDGTAYDASAFGETDTTTGEWIGKTSPSVTYGTNGFFILKDGNGITDQSGEGNDFTLGGGTLTDLKDNPDNVFATLNPLDNIASSTFSEGNNTVTTVNSNAACNTSTLGAISGKYYWEVKMTAGESNQESYIIGLVNASPNVSGYDGSIMALGFGLRGNGNINGIYGQTTGWNTFAVNDIINIAVDFDNGKAYFGTNGSWGNSSNPSTGTNGYSFTVGSEFWRMAVNCRETSKDGVFKCNFGNGYFGTTAVASAGTNASGIGIFEYDVPTGYTALSTKGLNL